LEASNSLSITTDVQGSLVSMVCNAHVNLSNDNDINFKK
jgi:hypothetical protein